MMLVSMEVATSIDVSYSRQYTLNHRNDELANRHRRTYEQCRHSVIRLCYQTLPAFKLLAKVLTSNSLNCRGSSSRSQSFPTNTPTNAPTVNSLSTHFLVLPGSTSTPRSSLNTKSCLRQNTLRSQYMNCQSGYIILFKPVLGSTAQLVHPLAQTSFFASRCVHSKSFAAASGRTSTVAGAEPAKREGSRDRD